MWDVCVWGGGGVEGGARTRGARAAPVMVGTILSQQNP